jgi:F420-dependent oxidoreductase-like protein
VKVGVFLGGGDPGSMQLAIEADRLGVDSAWMPEFWAHDALTPLAYLAGRTSSIRLGTAIVQVGARSPAMLAMSSMSMQALSGGRFILGIGASGPQVMEGWHGVPYGSPLRTTRETIEIIRTVASGDRLDYDGQVYQVPLSGGAGRPMRSAASPVDIPIYVASLGPRNLELTGELADGWIGNSFLPEHAEVFLSHLRAGATGAGRSLAELDLCIPVAVEFTDDVEGAGRRHADGYAFTIGAMGSATQNFYNDAFARQGYADDVAEVQRLWRAGEREQAAARVPLELGLQTNLLGTADMIAERVRLYRQAGVTTLLAKLGGDADERLANLEQLLEVVGATAEQTKAPQTPQHP